MLNQVSLTGRCFEREKRGDDLHIIVSIYRFEDDKIEYIPVEMNSNTQNRIGFIRTGDLVGITGRLKFENDSIKVIADRISYVG